MTRSEGVWKAPERSGMRLESAALAELPSGADLIKAGKPYMPRSAGSVLRSYLREIHGQRV